MKKYLLFLGVAMCCTSSFIACSDNDDDPIDTVGNEPTPSDSTQTPTDSTVVAAVTQAVYIVNAGNQWTGIDGSLTAFNPATSIAADGDAFATANGRSLGNTPNDGLVYGSKLYIVSDGESRIEVVNAGTLQSIAAISTVEMLGGTAGISPRHIIAHNGLVYVSTYGSTVAAIDTADFSLKARYDVGSYPEGMAIVGNTLYVANSDYGQAQNASLSAIDLSTGSVAEIQDDLVKNPSALVAVGNTLYIVDGDVYGPAPDYAFVSQGGLRQMENGQISQVMNGSMTMGANQVAVYNGKVYVMQDSYYAPKLMVLDTATGASAQIKLQAAAGIDFELGLVNGLAVDPTNGDIYTVCYHVNAETGYGDYSGPGFANRFDNSGWFISSFATGVGPNAVIFNIK